VIPIKRVMAEKRAIVVPLLVALAANVVLFAVAVYPLSRRVGSAEQRAAAARAARRKITYLRLDRLARESGLEPGHTRFSPKEVRNSSLTELETTAELTGDYRSIRRFLYLLETSPEFTIIQNLALASSEEGELRLTLSLATYYRTTGDGN
jgi:hypothetical protein